MFAIPKGSGTVHLTVLATLIVVGTGGGCHDPDATHAPPRPPALDTLDPDLAARIREAIERVEQDTQAPSGWMTLGMIYEANRMFDLALTCYERAVELGPDAPRAWYRLALMRGRAGELQPSLTALQRVNQLEPIYGPAHWKRGFALLDAGQLDAAEAAFRRAAEIEARDPAPWAGLARVYIKRGNAAEAIRLLETAVTDQPQHRYFHHLLGIAYREAAAPEKAEAHLRLGRDSVPTWLDPWSLELNHYKAGVRWVLSEADRARRGGRYDLAIPALEDLRKKEPTDQQILAVLAKAYIGSGQVEEGLDTLRLMLDLHGDAFRAHLDAATAYEQAGRLETALAHADRSIELNPDFAAAHRRRGQILRRMGRFEDAAVAIGRSLELDPDDSTALTVLGECLLEVEDWDAARSYLERAVHVQPDNAHAFLKLGIARIRLGNLDGAREALRKAAELDSRYADQADELLAGIARRTS